MNNRAVELLDFSDDDWKVLALTLRFHAEFRIRQHFGDSGRLRLPQGFTVDDLVLDSIAAVIDGRFACDVEATDRVGVFRAAFDAKLERLIQRTDQRSALSALSGSGAKDAVPPPAARSGLEFERLLLRLREALPSHLIGVLEAIVDGYRPVEIASRVGISLDEVYARIHEVRTSVGRVWQEEDTQ